MSNPPPDALMDDECNACKGEGMFILPATGHVITCKRCDGTGHTLKGNGSLNEKED